MSFRDYEISTELNSKTYWSEDFYALIMVAMRNADASNQEKLRAAWPDVWAELELRYNAPAGLLVGESKPEAEGMLERREDGLYFLPPGGGDEQLVRAV